MANEKCQCFATTAVLMLLLVMAVMMMPMLMFFFPGVRYLFHAHSSTTAVSATFNLGNLGSHITICLRFMYICIVHAFFALFLVVLCIAGAVTVMNPLRTAANGYVRMFFRGKLVSLTKDGASGA